MQDRIIDIILQVASSISKQRKFTQQDYSKLESSGYNRAEISTAFSWLNDKCFLQDFLTQSESKNNSTALRFLDESELQLFTKDAINELTQLQSLRLITNEQIDFIIEKITPLDGYRLDAHTLKLLIAHLSFGAMSNNIPNNRIMLNGNDTIQ